MKANPTAFDLLLAYAECAEAHRSYLRFDIGMGALRAIMRTYGASDTEVWAPIQFLDDLRRRALDAARKEAEDGK